MENCPLTVSRFAAEKAVSAETFWMVRPALSVSSCLRVMVPVTDGEMVKVPWMVEQEERRLSASACEVIVVLEVPFHFTCEHSILMECMSSAITIEDRA